MGVELEEAGEKWKAGDSAKALRFFLKAVNQYDAGLQNFPTSFDLAYNKARLQYAITQQPRLIHQLPGALLDYLTVAGSSHDFALKLHGENPDVLFNLAQVYSSLAEALLETQDDIASQRSEASNLLHQALNHLQHCLEVQKESFAKADWQPQSPVAGECEELTGKHHAESAEEVWVSVVEPVTEDTLLDTHLAQLACLKSLCDIQSSAIPDKLAFIEDAYTRGLDEVVDQYAQRTNHDREVKIARAAFLSSYANARFRLYRTNPPAFEGEFGRSISPLEMWPGFNGDTEALCLSGDAHLEVNVGLETRITESAEPSRELCETVNRLRWVHITKALDRYTLASKVPNQAHLARIHISRGDCELLRCRLGDEPFNYDLAEKSRVTLVKNASIYYGAAAMVTSRDPQMFQSAEDTIELEIKVGVVAALQDDQSQILTTALQRHSVKGREQLHEISEQGLVGGKAWDKIKHVVATS